MNRSAAKLVYIAVLALTASGCSTVAVNTDPALEESQTIDGLNSEFHDQTLAVGNRIPRGVVRYCWEEPMVEFEPNGPGVDATGKWYNPYYLAVREVRMGKWRPCRQGSENQAGGQTAPQTN